MLPRRAAVNQRSAAIRRAVIASLPARRHAFSGRGCLSFARKEGSILMKNLTKLRMDRGWSKAELARQSHLHPTQIGLFESGRLIPYASQVAKLAVALGVTGDPNDLLSEAED